MARTMLQEYEIPQGFWPKAVNTACYMLNRVFIQSIVNKTPYKLQKNKKPKISYFRVFGSKCFVLHTRRNQDKFPPKCNEGIIVGYSLHSKAYRVFIKWSQIVIETLHVDFDEHISKSHPSSNGVEIDNSNVCPDHEPTPKEEIAPHTMFEEASNRMGLFNTYILKNLF